jgi:hypothetical protein
MLFADGRRQALETMPKAQVAQFILDAAARLLQGDGSEPDQPHAP